MLSDKEIIELEGMIEPFITHQVKELNGRKAVSYGLSSAGYDIRLSDKGCFILRGGMDIKNTDNLTQLNVPIDQDDSGQFYHLPPLASVLASSVERFDIPYNICGTATGKSTYARAGLIINITPLEPGWSGWLTLELFNTTMNPLRVYIGEGICQIQFHKITRPLVTYDERGGKYLNQSESPTLPKI